VPRSQQEVKGEEARSQQEVKGKVENPRTLVNNWSNTSEFLVKYYTSKFLAKY
jgi:hypothetical protein